MENVAQVGKETEKESISLDSQRESVKRLIEDEIRMVMDEELKKMAEAVFKWMDKKSAFWDIGCPVYPNDSYFSSRVSRIGHRAAWLMFSLKP